MLFTETIGHKIFSTQKQTIKLDVLWIAHSETKATESTPILNQHVNRDHLTSCRSRKPKSKLRKPSLLGDFKTVSPPETKILYSHSISKTSHATKIPAHPRPEKKITNHAARELQISTNTSERILKHLQKQRAKKEVTKASRARWHKHIVRTQHEQNTNTARSHSVARSTRKTAKT